MARTRNNALGFTLLELVVALTLTSLVVLVIYSSFNITLKGMQRGWATAEFFQELRVGQVILERSISSAVLGSVGRRLYFHGTSREMRFFTVVPLEASNLGGVYHWRILVGQGEQGRKVLAVEQTKNVNWRRDQEGVEVRQIIFRNLTSAHITYGRGENPSATWDAKTQGMLPSWVKIILTFKGHQPMILVIPIYVAEN
ncbi:prepilin-type N-terminal cleavage/methylation domain-containing protein [Desulfobacca acetoxidans]|uniref:Prepilin-type N-terminal cleavage/methylation domain-containing protein n=1 Tax=Desulfobacca acetoxidans (strain ATCC 700848 / DSM 11109 / ASRB2) TaxID=880072 RepID=F2NGQ8_DESAR|nr:prepilin-type N-terminal cleavage/methylation domain-containing protein [Desulfobacca acetoxidans]AEB08679.1 hypothetical protein Desac_0800 [Desulfobacca acetoxidans DSM 11109]